jgi:hypothetical protein
MEEDERVAGATAKRVLVCGDSHFDASVGLVEHRSQRRNGGASCGRSIVRCMQTLVLALIVVYAIFFVLIHAIVVRRDR